MHFEHIISIRKVQFEQIMVLPMSETAASQLPVWVCLVGQIHIKQVNLMILAEYFELCIYCKCLCTSVLCLVTSYETALSTRMEMLLRGNLRRRVGLCLLLLALVHESTGQRRKTGRRNNNYRLHDDGGNGNSFT